MIQELIAAGVDGVELGKVFADWHEYAALQPLGDEPSVPIIYVPR